MALPKLRNRMRELMTSRPSAIGTFVTMTDSTVVDLAALAGFEFVVAECEHSGLSLETVAHHIRAARDRDLGFMVRVPAGDWGFVQRVLDVGAEGVLVPHVRDPDQAKRAVAAVRYPPSGHRGMYPAAAAAQFGAHGLPGVAELTEALNAGTVLAVMVEDASALDSVDDILKVQGVDIVTIGPSDLSASLGVIGQPDDPRLRTAIDTVMSACRAVGIPFGFPVNAAAFPRSAQDLRAMGAWMLTMGSDASLLLGAMQAAAAR